jgi:UDP-N-acetyl-D-mannosaminuronate dehydrogenase
VPTNPVVIVAGMGEVGRPLFHILGRAHPCIAVDIEPVEVSGACSVLHICYPFQIPGFLEVTAGYMERYRPEITIINSTVAPGTTRRLYNLAQRPVVFSPVRGKHAKMESDMLRYKKFVAGVTAESTKKAADHFAQAGFLTDSFRTPEIAELSKLVETTWLGVLVGWAQEVERMASQQGATYEEINAFIQEIDFLPSHVFPGQIGGHCVLPNIEILQSQYRSELLEAVTHSNRIKCEESLTVVSGERNQCSKSA